MDIHNQLTQNGFSIIENIYAHEEIDAIFKIIEAESKDNWHFKKQKDLFAIRCFLKEISALNALVLNEKLKQIIESLNPKYRIVKSIYFDKPPRSNWPVNWHQDLTISVSNKENSEGYKNWLSKEEYFSVQPPDDILKDIVTVRIHLDDCTVENGALRVLPKSHSGVHDYVQFSEKFDTEQVICEVKKGGVLLMKPLIFHSSKRTENATSRRVIHIEFSSKKLDNTLIWHEL
jgi:ectoine hydroxylase-related dioxygenase (phytanoyl-CoA dioxygenase family)